MFELINLCCLLMFYEILGFFPEICHFTPLLALQTAVKCPQTVDKLDKLLNFAGSRRY
jgi:hypothetical protein